ncbi:hypothetical protein KM043_007974 [Ampulex compressa]|nr:hypothetical protein KM043_007974 [Ampulex compressa]
MKLLLLLSLVTLALAQDAQILTKITQANDVPQEATNNLQITALNTPDAGGEKKIGKRSYGWSPVGYGHGTDGAVGLAADGMVDGTLVGLGGTVVMADMAVMGTVDTVDTVDMVDTVDTADMVVTEATVAGMATVDGIRSGRMQKT